MTSEQWAQLSVFTAEFFYVIIGLIFLLLGIRALKRVEGWQRYTTFAFWTLLAFTFIFGKYIPFWITGACIVAIAVMTLIKGVKPAKLDPPKAEDTRREADLIGFKVFIPALVLALGAVLVATFVAKLGANNAIGISEVMGLVTALILTKAKPVQALEDGIRLTDNVGTVGILPQLLAALGALFTAAGVGTVIAKYVSAVIPDGNRFMAALVYCLGMALFTIIMGNGFAAFSVITVGIGIPFLIMQGANPIVVGALGLTAGYCGTLLTPMAANFNIMPAALLETKNKYAIIKAQVPVALTMLVIHVFLMYFLAF